MKSYDVTVIGSGPGGYVAAIRCAQLGLKTALIEKYNTLGGTCLNVGCIPSKALLDSSHHYEDAVKHFDTHGIEIPGEIKVNLEKMIARKQAVVDQTTGGIDFLMKKNKIDVFHGLGSFKDATHILISKEDKNVEEIESKNTIIATGSKPSNLPFIELDKERIITSTEALKLKEVPKHMVVIGGGVIGLELGQVYKRLGAEVTVVEYMDRIIPTMDAALLSKMNQRDQIKNCIIDGPLAFDNAVSFESAKQKKIKSEVAGDTDLLLMPDIEVGNVLYKSLVFFAKAKVASVILGASAPIVLTSRSDSEESKFNSILLAAIGG